MNKLSKEKTFDYDSKELLGVMRFDFYDGRLANQWSPRDLIIELNNKNKIDFLVNFETSTCPLSL